jgi:hypothetical protein
MAFNSSTVQTMFNYPLATVFAEIDTNPKLELQSLVVGNEIDGNSDFHTCQVTPQLSAPWQQYKEFFENQRTFARNFRPTLKVGITGTFSGLTNASLQPCFTQLLANADFVSVTYYPMDSDFRMKAPSVVSEDFAKIVQMYSGKEIFFQEVGYAIGAAFAGSSETQQSQFYTNLFQAWDQNSDFIKMVSIVNLHEWADSTVDGFGNQYGVCPGTLCNAFKDYLKTIGIRTYPQAGSDKPAFQTIINESKARGWN